MVVSNNVVGSTDVETLTNHFFSPLSTVLQCIIIEIGILYLSIIQCFIARDETWTALLFSPQKPRLSYRLYSLTQLVIIKIFKKCGLFNSPFR